MATSSKCTILSFIAPVKLNFLPTSSSSNLGQSIPGVSNSCNALPTLIHCCCLVTPGLLPVCVILRFASLFINVDLPTFGIPTIIALLALGLSPFAFSRSNFSAVALIAAASTFFKFLPCLASTDTG